MLRFRGMDSHGIPGGLQYPLLKEYMPQMIIGPIIRFKRYSLIKGYWSLWVPGGIHIILLGLAACWNGMCAVCVAPPSAVVSASCCVASAAVAASELDGGTGVLLSSFIAITLPEPSRTAGYGWS